MKIVRGKPRHATRESDSGTSYRRRCRSVQQTRAASRTSANGWPLPAAPAPGSSPKGRVIDERHLIRDAGRAALPIRAPSIGTRLPFLRLPLDRSGSRGFSSPTPVAPPIKPSAAMPLIPPTKFARFRRQCLSPWACGDGSYSIRQPLPQPIDLLERSKANQDIGSSPLRFRLLVAASIGTSASYGAPSVARSTTRRVA